MKAGVVYPQVELGGAWANALTAPVLLPCPLHVLLPRYPRFLGARLHLSHLSHFRGPAQSGRSRSGVALRASAPVRHPTPTPEKISKSRNRDISVRWRQRPGPRLTDLDEQSGGVALGKHP